MIFTYRKSAHQQRFPGSRLSTLDSRLSALTLVEMLVSMAITLVMMAAVVNLFANVGSSVSNRRAIIEISGQLRMARMRLQKDLAGATCDGIPKSKMGDNDKADGYIEIVEGQYSDKFPSLLTDGIDNGVTSTNPELDYAASLVPSSNFPLATGRVTDGGGLGDYDDILALTVRSEDEPFVGRGLASNPSVPGWVARTIESDQAEVIWYAVENPADGSLGEPGMRTVYRRALLIAPWIGPINPATLVPPMANPMDASEFFRRFDISARFDGTTSMWIPNTVADLIKREYRFAHVYNQGAINKGFPHLLMAAAIIPDTTSPPAFPVVSVSPLHPFGLPFEWNPSDSNPSDPSIPPTPNRQGEDVMLSDVLAFDVRVYDPGAPLLNASGTVVAPSEAGWGAPTTVVNLIPVGFGAYVDLYWNVIGTWSSGTQRGWTTTVNDPPRLFEGVPSPMSGLNFAGIPNATVAYDTWSFHYEDDGINQDGDMVGTSSAPLIDEGTNGLDDDGINGVDDLGERETLPPYNVSLQGIQVKLRVYERDSRNIRETSVIQSFN